MQEVCGNMDRRKSVFTGVADAEVENIRATIQVSDVEREAARANLLRTGGCDESMVKLYSAVQRLKGGKARISCEMLETYKTKYCKAYRLVPPTRSPTQRIEIIINSIGN